MHYRKFSIMTAINVFAVLTRAKAYLVLHGMARHGGGGGWQPDIMAHATTSFQRRYRPLPIQPTWFSSQLRTFCRPSFMQMMPEGPEVRTLVDQLQGGVGRRLVDIRFLSGRYVHHGPPVGFQAFAQTMTPLVSAPSSRKATIDNTEGNMDRIPPSTFDSDVDVIQEWNAKGKFMYIILKEKQNERPNTTTSDNNCIIAQDGENSDYQRSIWITLGMSGRFVTERGHQQDPRYARWYLELMSLEPQIPPDAEQFQSTNVSTTTLVTKFHKIYYHDQRNFGTLKFCLSKQELDQKLASLGSDILDSTTTEQDWLQAMTNVKQDVNICQFLMDQSKISGIGNYIVSECLYRANIDPFASIEELSMVQRQTLFQQAQAVAKESYQSQGLTRESSGTFRNIHGDPGRFKFQLQCYGRKICPKGNIVHEVQGPHKRTIWYVQDQLFQPLEVRKRKQKQKKDALPSHKDGGTIGGTSKSNTDKLDDSIDSTFTEITSSTLHSPPSNIPTFPPDHLLSGLTDPGWINAFSRLIQSGVFDKLQKFLEQEHANGITVYPERQDIFAAFNLCPLESTKVVIVGQDPYHQPGQGHGLAFSVLKGVPLPPSLKNICKELPQPPVDLDNAESSLAESNHEQNVFTFPKHGNLEHWARQGVLLLNTVLTVRHGEAHSHKNQGWEEVTDEVIRILNEQSPVQESKSIPPPSSQRRGLVFLLWGQPAARKAQTVNTQRGHVVIQTSHPSPLGASKTSSPFLGSNCFGRANDALIAMGHKPIDWTIR